MALSLSFVRCERGYEVAYGAGALVVSKSGFCEPCAKDQDDAVPLVDGECPRCKWFDWDDAPGSKDACADCASEHLGSSADEDACCCCGSSAGGCGCHSAEPEESFVPPPFLVDTAFGSVEVTPLADGRYVFKGPGTFGCRDTIKSASLAAGLAAGWHGAEKSWTVAAGTDLRAALPAPPPPPPPPPAPRRREDWTHEEYQNWLARTRRKVYGPCCRFAEAYETRPYGPICYRCERHGETHNSWTGD
jgi:hypothetical protein